MIIFLNLNLLFIEINELRSIINLSDSKSLVLGDELCLELKLFLLLKLFMLVYIHYVT